MSTRSLIIAAVAVVVVAALGLMVWLRLRAEPVPELTPCENGEWREWDKDADRIRDDFEDYARDKLGYDLDSRRCDEDPSRPEGHYNNGSLVKGLKIFGEHENFTLLSAEEADWGSGPLLHCLNEVADHLQRQQDKKMVVGRLSLQEGGPLDNYESHQNGLQLEIFYLRKGLGAGRPVDIVDEPGEYDEKATKFLMRSLVERCEPQAIFAHTGALGFDLPQNKIQHNENLRIHFDLLLDKPDQETGE